MPRLRYCGRDEDGEPIWKDPSEVPPSKERGHAYYRKPYHAMDFEEKVFDGYRQEEQKPGFRSAYSKADIKQTYGR